MDVILTKINNFTMPSSDLPAVHAMHWNNIPDAIRHGQKSVFETLQIELIQENADRQSHGLWMNEVIARHHSDDIIVFCDIDAFPIQRSAYLEAIESAKKGFVFGLAQFSNHKKNKELYAGPMFMAFQKRTWERLGKPSLKSNTQYDAAEGFSALARESSPGLQLVMPSSCLIPKYALGNQGVFGIGTFYGACDFFHLFESRRPAYETLFSSVVDDIVAGHALNFKKYLEIAEASQKNAPPTVKKNSLSRFFRNLFLKN